MGNKFCIKDIEEKINNVRDDVIIIDYNGMNIKSNFECKVCGHKWLDLPVRIIDNKRCPNCKQNNKVQIIEKAQDLLCKSHGNNIIIKDFVGTSLYYGRFFLHCNICENDWDTSIEPIIRGNGCRKCADNKRKIKLYKSEKDILEWLENNDFNFIKYIENFKGRMTKMIIQYSCGHIGETTYSCLTGHNSSICPNCSFEESKKKKMVSIEILKERFINKGFELLSIEDREKGVSSPCEYRCVFGHITKRKMDEFFINPSCSECKREKIKNLFSGENSLRWKGGITQINKYVRRNMKSWNLKSAKNCNYLCVIENKPFNVIHHLYSFNLIINDVLRELEIPIKSSVGEYTEEELILIKEKALEKHNGLLGVCLTKYVHEYFHKLYGLGNNTPEQFYEFQKRIQSGELIIPS